MKKHLFALLISLLFFSSCSDNSVQKFEHAGGTFTMALENEPSTYISREVADYYSATVLSQVTECLVGMNPKTTEIVPQLASSWEKVDGGKKYIFTLRDDAYFHPHKVFSGKKDRKLTAEDVVKTFEMGCRKNEQNLPTAMYSFIFKSLLKGADEFHQGTANTISGLSVNNNKLTIELTHKDHNFLYKLSNVSASIISKKIIESENETDVIGTGPFMYSQINDGDQRELVLLRNNDYYLKDESGNSLPYLDSLVFIFQSRKLEQLDLFESGKTDLIVGLPTGRITRMLEGRIEDFNSKPPKLVLANNPLLESHFYFFNLSDKRFEDPRVRKAFNYAIDKTVIGQEILRNQFYDLGDYGITPPVNKALKGYDFKNIKSAGYDFNPEKARQLLAEAGYPNGEGFGSVELRYDIDDTHSAVADEFSKQIFRVLGININIDGSSFEQLNEDGAIGNGDIFRMGWSADYPSPETFLLNFYGKYVPEDIEEPSTINKSRYVNPVFDQLYEKASESQKITDQMNYFCKAEIALLEDPPLIPLWYTGDIEIVYSYVRNFHFNALNTFNFTNVYLKEWTTEEYQEFLAESK
ncbi:MAG: peptide ABC transporter substrate-binding protein [Crocinitomicaceae bacterium]|nr:peptide ABC transporter substrate-binding protein [Crocinitomicaceae bacterium]